MEALAARGCVRMFRCGPVSIRLRAGDESWLGRLASELMLFDVPWEPELEFAIDVAEGSARGPEVKGTFLRCARYQVDREGAQFRAQSLSGASCELDMTLGRARIFAPRGSQDNDVREDVEQFLLFVVVHGWRRLGWTPLHVGSVVGPEKCALLCATSGGGKSTFTAALLRRGFRTLGDDKLLAKRVDGMKGMAVRAISRSMNLDPAVARWFPEAAGLSDLPPYSRWTPKRKAVIERLWPGATIPEARPRLLFKLLRSEECGGIRMQRLEPWEVREALARQVVIPSDREAARPLLETIMALAEQLEGWRVVLGRDAYEDPKTLRPVEEMLL